MSAKVKYPRMAALSVAKELCDLLKPVTQRLIVAGSLRRRKEQVGDVEIVFIPKWEHRQVRSKAIRSGSTSHARDD